MPRLSITLAFCGAIAAIPLSRFYVDVHPRAFRSSVSEVDFGLVEPGAEPIEKIALFNSLPQTVSVAIRSSCDGVDVRPERFDVSPGMQAEFVIELNRRSGDRGETLITTLSTDIVVVGSVQGKENEPAGEIQIPISIQAQFFEPYAVIASDTQILCDLVTTSKSSVGFSAAGSQVGEPQVASTSGCVKSASVTWSPNLSAGEIVVQCESGLPPGNHKGTITLQPTLQDDEESSVEASVASLIRDYRFQVPIQLTVAKPFSLDTQLVILRGPVGTSESIRLVETIDGVRCRIAKVKQCPSWLQADIRDDGRTLVLVRKLVPSVAAAPLEIEVSVADGKFIVSETVGCVSDGSE